jgi:hypothetical protein
MWTDVIVAARRLRTRLGVVHWERRRKKVCIQILVMCGSLGEKQPRK